MGIKVYPQELIPVHFKTGKRNCAFYFKADLK